MRRTTWLVYGIAWVCVKYATFARSWDWMVVSFVAFVVMCLGFMVWDWIMDVLHSYNERGNERGLNILLIAVIIVGSLTILGDFFHIGWYVKFGNPIVDGVVDWGLAIGVSVFGLRVIANTFFRRDEGGEQ